MQNIKAHSQTLQNILVHASLMAHFYQTQETLVVWNKQGEGPCTNADIAINDLLRKKLHSSFPEIDWLSEESINTIDRLKSKYIWIVDPIDGTNDYIHKGYEYSISLGLAYQENIIWGGVALPANNEIILNNADGEIGYWTYQYPENWTQKELENIDFSKISWTSKIIKKSQCIDLKKAQILVSRFEWKKNRFASMKNDLNFIPHSSIARKLSLLSLGFGDLVISLSPKHEWDIAGGVGLIKSIPNYKVIDLKYFKDHAFNQKETRSVGLVAGPTILVDQFCTYWKEKNLQVYESY